MAHRHETARDFDPDCDGCAEELKQCYEEHPWTAEEGE